MILNIEQPSDRPPPFALFQLGFRPLFLGAILYSVIAMLLWTFAYGTEWMLPSCNGITLSGGMVTRWSLAMAWPLLEAFYLPHR